MIVKLMALFIALALPLSMAGQNSQNAGQQAQNQQTRVQLSQADQSFLKALIEEDISEINLAHLALKKSSDPQVRDYAQTKILAADPAMRDGAEKLAREGGMTPPTKPNARQQKEYDKLYKKSGTDFDNAYMSYETSQQAADYELVQTELKSTSNDKVKNYTEKQEKPVHEAAVAAKDIHTSMAQSMMRTREEADKH